MKEKITQALYRKADIFKALAHPVRLFFIERLAAGPKCVCELANEAGISKSIASRYLSQLKSVGLLDRKKSGTEVEYSLIAPCVINLIACLDSSVVDNIKKNLR
ncbi:metalloregulator ArsR/SmtB family transcription factor [Spirochaetia bacterium 38H-sp]|uniref:Metalloregulator ArsR/SmtB family transcription factor n=1 Tax=Rarispira pelagica TaxID=3141764 RepID=A0ABU9UE35_9SPIR